MEREEFEEKVEEIKQTQDYFAVYVFSQVIYAEDYKIDYEFGYEKLYLYYCEYLIAKLLLNDVEEVDYSWTKKQQKKWMKI